MVENTIIETTMDDVVTTVPEVAESVGDVVAAEGSLGKVAGIVGGVAVVSGLIYGAVRYLKKKKAAKTETDETQQDGECSEVDGDNEI